ncbi:hypothetical protein RB195_001755 [Necator americanus]|uniref:Uncharacterized protein n=1 Tax=Necator americanus TaxID=51031 RepID=A0ABR1DGB8_NECAM
MDFSSTSLPTEAAEWRSRSDMEHWAISVTQARMSVARPLPEAYPHLICVRYVCTLRHSCALYRSNKQYVCKAWRLLIYLLLNASQLRFRCDLLEKLVGSMNGVPLDVTSLLCEWQ